MKGLLLLMLLPVSSLAQDALFTADLQLLSRGEIRNGGMTSDSDDPDSEDKSAFILNRELLTLGYKRNWLESKLSVHHAGTWGHEGASGINLFEGWGKVTARNGLFAQIGRIALSYDDERIIGSDDWVVAPMTHDALRLGYEGHGHKVHAILCYNQNNRAMDEPGSYYSDGNLPYKTMQTAWYHYDVPKIPLGFSLLFMSIGMQSGTQPGTQDNQDAQDALMDDPPHTEWQFLYGGYLKYTPPHFSLECSYYRQTGHDEHRLKLDTWMATIKAEWTPNDKWSVNTGFDYLSGDDYVSVLYPGSLGLPQHKVNKGFTPTYGSHHKFYGAMDFFYVSTYVEGFTPGLQNAYIGGTYSPLKNLRFNIAYHYIATGIGLEDLNQTLGHELEFEISYTPLKNVTVSAGYSYMTGTKTMERLKRASSDGRLRWGWLSVVISPRLLTIQ